MKSVGPFDASVVLELGGRQDHQGDVHFLTSGFKVRHEFRTSINLNAEDREMADFFEIFKELGGPYDLGMREDIGVDELRSSIPNEVCPKLGSV